MSKLSDCLEFLRSDPDAEGMSNAEIAERFDTTEATPRRAKAILKAEAIAANGSGYHGEDVKAWLDEVLEASEAEDSIRLEIQALDAEKKELKKALKDATGVTRGVSARVRSAFRETYPLFDRSEPAEAPEPAPTADTVSFSGAQLDRVKEIGAALRKKGGA